MKRSSLVRSNAFASLTVKAKKCKVCKAEFFPARPMQIACGLDCAKAYAAKVKEGEAKEKRKAEAKQDKTKREALKTIPDLIKEAQIAFNRFVRLRDAGRGCISCGTPLSLGGVGGGFDCGHYRSRGAAGHLRFHEDNAHGQCKFCNRHQAGNVVAFRAGLLERIGQQRLAALELDNLTHKWTRQELQAIRATYTAKAKALKASEQGLPGDNGRQLGACSL